MQIVLGWLRPCIETPSFDDHEQATVKEQRGDEHATEVVQELYFSSVLWVFFGAESLMP